MPNNMRVLGIDPGYGRCGVAVVEKSGKEILLYSACIDTPVGTPFTERLLLLSRSINAIVQEFSPTEVAIEELFFSTNTKTALKVAEARGVLIHSALLHNLPVHEYNPGSIKIAITGYGKSDKKQIITMIPRLVSLNEKIIKHDDEYDAIAVALTHIASFRHLK